MGLFSRSAEPARAVHARVGDGEHLWLAVRGAEEPLALVDEDPGTTSIEAPTTAEGDLLTVVLPLAELLADDPRDTIDLTVVHGRRRTPVVGPLAERPTSPTVAAATTRDRRWQLSVHGTGDAVLVRRRPAAPGVPVSGFRVVDDGVELLLPGDRTLVVGVPADLVSGTPQPVMVDGVPVVRARNLLARPHAAVTLPPLPEPGTELRWLRDGRLAVVRR